MTDSHTVELLESASTEALAEAKAAGSLEEISEKIRAKLNPARDPSILPVEPMCYSWIRATYPDHVIVDREGSLFEVPYTVADNGDLTLGDPIKVVMTYERITEASGNVVTTTIYTRAPDRPAPAAGADPSSGGAPVELTETMANLLEAKDKAKGSAWDVLLIKAGTSGNGKHYSAKVLKEAAKLFEGVQAFADHPGKDEQRNRPERSIRDVVGWFDGVKWDDAERGLRGTFHIVESADWLRSTLKSAWDVGKKDLLGFSIHALGTSKGRTQEGGILIEAIDKVVSTDVVTTPGAGGRLLDVLESARSTEVTMDPEEVKRLIAEAMAAGLTGLATQLKESLAAEIATLRATSTAVAEAPATQAVVTETAPVPVNDEIVALREAVTQMRRESRGVAIAHLVDQANLPAGHTTKLKARLLEAFARRDVDDTEIAAEIGFVRELIAESGPARPNWPVSIDTGKSEHDKMVLALTGWFTGANIDGVPAVRDLRESYGQWNRLGYLDVEPYEFFHAFNAKYDSGRHHVKIQESLGTSDWGQVFADVFYLQMIQEYKASPDYDRWRMIVSTTENVPDFRTRHWTRVGGYGDLASVAERGTYPALTSPGDEEVSYAVAKYGGIDDISMEMVLGDRIAIVRQLPRMMGYAAARTLYKFVLDMATTGNPTMEYDSTALYHSDHANTGTTALSITGMDAVNVAMRSQTAYGASSENLGTRNKPKYLIVPNELESLALRIIAPSDAYTFALSSSPGADQSSDPQRWARQGLEVLVYDQLTDATDWWVVADPMQQPTIVMGFLNGRQEPELFTQDQPNVGSTFTADKISMKVRHVFGGDVMDHRGFYRQVVSGS